MRLAVLLVLAAGCYSAAADHEKLGDEAQARGDYATAVVEYRAAAQGDPRSRVLAKLGLAALHQKNYREAADAYRRLGEVDPSRSAEAATGLDRVAAAAQRGGDAVAVREALAGIRALAPDRPAGRMAVPVAMAGSLAPVEALELLPYALAGAGDGRTVDSLLLIYGAALRETTACEDAARVFGAVLRRNPARSPAAAGEGLAACALQLGHDAAALREPAIAERWYRKALDATVPTDLARQALLGLGDSRLAQWDTAEAMDYYQSVIDRGGPADSLGSQAAARMLTLGVAAPPAPSPIPERQ